MTARLNTTVYNVGITFDGADGKAGTAELIETSPLRSSERTAELFLSGLSEQISAKALTALSSGRAVDVRVLGVYGSWTVAEMTDHEPGVHSFHLTSRGPIMVGAP
jgi:hypothetical protein